VIVGGIKIKGGVDGHHFFCTQLYSLMNVRRRGIAHCGGDHALLKVGEMDIFGRFLGLGLGLISGQKKEACPARGPKQDREIFRGCMSRSPYKP